MSKEETADFKRGFQAALDRRRMYVDFETEKAMPVDWDEYTDKYEREVVASIVSMPEYQQHFLTNMMRQAMLKWRQARLSAGDPEKTKLLFAVGNAIMELVEFYSHAADPEVPKTEETDGFNSFQNDA